MKPARIPVTASRPSQSRPGTSRQPGAGARVVSALLASMAVAGACLAGTSTTDPGPDMIELTGGDRLHGTVVRFDSSAGGLTLARTDADRPLRFHANRVLQIRPGARGGGKLNANALLTLNNGDVMPVEVMEFDERGLVCSSALGTGERVARDTIRSVLFSTKAAPLFYVGPASLDEWVEDLEAVGLHAMPGAWRFAGGVLSSIEKGSAPIAKVFDQLPERLAIEFRVDVVNASAARSSWGPSFMLGLREVKKQNRQDVFSIRRYGTQISGGWASRMARGERLSGQAKGNKAGNIQLFVDLRRRLAVVGWNGERVGSSTGDRDDSPPTSLALTIRTTGFQGGLSVSDVRVRAWGGTLPAGWSKKSAPRDEDLVDLANGDTSRGKIESISGDPLRLRQADLDIPVSRVSHVTLAGSDTPSKDSDVIISLRGGGMLHARGVVFAEGTLKADTQAFGVRKLDPSNVDTIDLAAGRKRGAEGFIRTWLGLSPFPLGEAAKTHTEESQKALFDKEYFPGQFRARPRPGETVEVKGEGEEEPRTLTWTAVDCAVPWQFKQVDNSMYLAVTYIHCEEEIDEVTLSIGSDDSSLWRLNDEEVIRVYVGRGVKPDQSKSAPLTLRKGVNVLSAAVINGWGGAGLCARFFDFDGTPLTDFTVKLPEPGKKPNAN